MHFLASPWPTGWLNSPSFDSALRQQQVNAFASKKTYILS